MIGEPNREMHLGLDRGVSIMPASESKGRGVRMGNTNKEGQRSLAIMSSFFYIRFERQSDVKPLSHPIWYPPQPWIAEAAITWC